MLDTISLTLNQTQFEVLDMARFSPSALGLYTAPYYTLGARNNVRCYQNPTKSELSRGIYKPRLTLTKRKARGAGHVITLRCEFSAPKLLFGNNFDELDDSGFERLLCVLYRRLQDMGIRVQRDVLRNASVSAIHYSKNVALMRYSSCAFLLGQLGKVSLNTRLDLSKTDYRNGGHAVRYHANSYELIFYDKIKDMQQAKISEKRAIESDCAVQRDLFSQARVIKPPDVLRMELRIGNRTKLKRQLKALGIDCPMDFSSLFKLSISRAMLLHYWRIISEALPIQALSHFDPQDVYYAMMTETKGTVKPAKLLQRIGALAIIHNVGMTGLHSLLSGHSDARTWQRLKRELKVIDVGANMQYNAVRYVGAALAKFEPLKVNRFRSGDSRSAA